jgi:hypothetical protein
MSSKMEKNLSAWASARKNWLEQGIQVKFAIERKRNRTWNFVAVCEDDYYGLLSRASGCGYCKMSAVLSDVLHAIDPICGDGGSGVEYVIQRFNRLSEKYTVELIWDGRSEMAFELKLKT